MPIVQSVMVYLQFIGDGGEADSTLMQKKITEYYSHGYRLFSHQSHIVPDGRILNIFVLEMRKD